MSKLPKGMVIRKIINYLRRSRQDMERENRTGEDTLTAQKNIMDRVLQEYGVPFDQVCEIGSGDRIETRPVFQQVLDDLRNGVYDAVAVKELSRLGRGDYEDLGAIYKLLEQKRIYIITPYKVFDPTNPSDARQIRFELFLSREEFITTRERMQGAKYSYAWNGKFMGSKPPYGYSYNSHTQRLEVLEEEAKVVQMIFDLYVNGLQTKPVSYRAIATFLTKAGIPSPTGRSYWNATHVRKLLKNRVYIGEIRYNMTKIVNGKRIQKPEEEWIVVEDAHPPLVDAELFNKAQKKHRQSAQPRTRLEWETSPLAGLIVCATCGKRMVRQATTSSYVKKSGDVSTYTRQILWCPTTGCIGGVKYEAAEEMLLQFLQLLQGIDARQLEVFLQDQLQAKSVSLSNQQIQERLQLIDKHIEALQQRLRFVRQKFEERFYSEEEFLDSKKAILHAIEQKEQLKKLLFQNPCPSHERPGEHDLQQIRKTLSSLVHTYHVLSNQEKNTLLRSMIENASLEITEKGKGKTPSKFNLNITMRVEGILPV